MIGYERIPAGHRAAVTPMADVKFSYTDYSFNDIVKSTEARALAVIRQEGGEVGETTVVIPHQPPKAPPLEPSIIGRPGPVLGCGDPAWQWSDRWVEREGNIWSEKIRFRETTGAGGEATVTFTGTGIALVGELTADGGRADVYVDGVKRDLIADAYIVPNTHDNDLWRVFGLAPGRHTLRLVMRADADPRSTGRRLTLTRAIAYTTQ
jgi:hypothetical protein